jgi:hypothetical protein
MISSRSDNLEWNFGTCSAVSMWLIYRAYIRNEELTNETIELSKIVYDEIKYSSFHEFCIFFRIFFALNDCKVIKIMDSLG